MYDWDGEKRLRNLAKHGVDFAVVDGFDWSSASIVLDMRRDYGEQRLRATGWLNDRLHVLIFTPRGNVNRVISLRKANKREKRKWHANRT